MAVTGRRVVVLHVFVKKSDKTPLRAIALARARMKELD
jgi:phage-related protein